MVKILYGHSYSRIAGLDEKDFKALRKELSYKIEVSRFIPNPMNHVAYCIDKKGNFASGLISRVRYFLDNSKITFEVIVPPASIVRTYPRTVVSPVKPYPDQLKAVTAALQTNRGVISAPTGSGKSFIIALLLRAAQTKTLIVVPTVQLKTQLRAFLDETLNTLKGIEIYNIDSPLLEKATDFDMLIIDEVHHAAATTYRQLNKTAWKEIPTRYSLSATPFRNKTEEQLLYEGVAGPIIYKLSYSAAVKQGYIVPIEAYYHRLPKVSVEGNSYREVYSELVVENQPRNEIIAETLLALQASDKYCLCLVKEIKHGKILEEATGIPFVNGGEEETRKYIQHFNQGKIKVLIGTTGVIGEGVDTKPCEYVIIAGLGKAKSSFMQNVGRCVRRFADKATGKVIIFLDPSHKWTRKHFNEQVKIIRDEYDTDVIQLD
jgi:superfamily II DNA or RNA helicase